jgi:hypothetical protein
MLLKEQPSPVTGMMTGPVGSRSAVRAMLVDNAVERILPVVFGSADDRLRRHDPRRRRRTCSASVRGTRGLTAPEVELAVRIGGGGQECAHARLTVANIDGVIRRLMSRPAIGKLSRL